MKIIRLILKTLLTILVFVILLNIIGPSTPNLNKQNIIYAHRGVVINCPENSSQSFNLAIEYGFEAVETDLLLTKDNKVILFHDKNALRLLGVDSLVKDMTLSQIKTKNILFNNSISNNKVLTLEEFILEFPFKYVYLDIKDSDLNLAKAVVEIIEKYNIYDRVFIADHSWVLLAYVKLLNSKIITCVETYDPILLLKSIIPKYFITTFFSYDIRYKIKKDRDYSQSNTIVYTIDSTNILNFENIPINSFLIDYDPKMGKEHSLQSYIKAIKGISN